MAAGELHSRWRLSLFVVGVVFLMVMWYGYSRWHSKSLSPYSLRSFSSSEKEVYIITGTYGGQMTRAIKNMLNQQCWAGTLKGSDVFIAEPFSVNSQLVHTPRIWNELSAEQLHTAARFSDYYNLTHYNLQSLKHRSAPLISWDDFLENAPRRAIAVRIPTHGCAGVKITSKCTFSRPFLKFMNGLSSMDFEIVERVCLACSTSSSSFTLDNFSDILFRNVSTTVSLLFDSWRNFGFTSSWIQIPDYCESTEKSESSDFLKSSYLISNHSQTYINRFVKKKPFLGIMLRIERFLTLAYSGRSNESVESCLNQTISTFDDIKLKMLNTGAFITVDIGNFGSGIMQKESAVSRLGNGYSIEALTKFVEASFSHIINKTMSLTDWETTFVTATGGIVERGYIAMLQRDIASHADCLILMGGGSFQEVAGFHYIANMNRRHKTPCIHTICVSENFKKLFQQ